MARKKKEPKVEKVFKGKDDENAEVKLDVVETEDVSSGSDIISSKSDDTLHTIKFLKWSIKSFIKFLISFPHTMNSFKILSDSLVFWSIIYLAKSNNCSMLTVPNNSTTSL